MHKYYLLLTFLFFSLNFIFPDDTEFSDFSKGPLYGKNMYAIFLIYLNFPGQKACEEKKYDFQYQLSTYLIQDFAIYSCNKNKYNKVGRYYDKNEIVRDYEGIVNELGISYNILDNFQISTNFRLYYFYGGFLDNTVETYHNLFNFPNGGRQYFKQNEIFINLPNENNINLNLDHPVVSFGDIDLWLKYTFYQNKVVSFASVSGLKIPTGKIEFLSGSGYPDIAYGILIDLRPTWVLTFYFQSGIVLPLDSILPVESKPFPMYNGLVGIEINPVSFFSINAQFNIKTSPIRKGELQYSWDKSVDAVSLPQINTLVGFIFQFKNLKWQIYFEEDSFTNQGTDWTLNFMFSHKFNFKKND